MNVGPFGQGALDTSTGEWPLVLTDGRNWRTVVPELQAPGVRIREVQPGDAAPLLTLLSVVDMARVVRLRPDNVAELAAQIDLARVERSEGRGLCLTVVPEPGPTPVGLFRIREIEAGFRSAEWDFVIAPEYWGRGLFFRVAPLVVDFVFDVLGAGRLEARTPLGGRSPGALRKLGAVQEAYLRHSNDEVQVGDEVLWAILAPEWWRRTGQRAVH